MIEAGNALRGAGGPGALAEKLVAQLLPEHNYVIDKAAALRILEAIRARQGTRTTNHMPEGSRS